MTDALTRIKMTIGDMLFQIAALQERVEQLEEQQNAKDADVQPPPIDNPSGD